ncbi:hypothetical protein HYW55_06825 [Candidatus Gottesmanbacteria bacterium]|nr:hypothetical protein [Candidatus Gottesmanbacteria bacterium]
MNTKKLLPTLVIVGIFLLAAFFRLYGNNWDQNYHLHPDERFLTMVTTALQWPKDIKGYLDTNTSTLNPHNMGFGFYVYGTFPIFFTKWIAGFFGWDTYINVTLLGRFLSGIVDLLTLILVYKIGKIIILLAKIKRGIGLFIPHISALLYGVTVLSIQLAHFYTVDIYLTFFLTLTFYFLIKILASIEEKHLTPMRLELLSLLMGISFGLSIGSKITSLLFLPIIGLGGIYFALKVKKIRLIFFCALTFILSTYLSLRFAQPYLFADSRIFTLSLNPKVIANWKELQALGNPTAAFPPAVQWIHTKAYLYPLKHTIFFGLGVPLTVILIVGIFFLFYSLRQKTLRKTLVIFFSLGFFPLFLSFLWILLLFGYQGGQFAMNLRYFHPIYPFLALVAGFGIQYLLQILPKRVIRIALVFGIGFLLLYPVAFMSIYNRPITRLKASQWIYENIPAGSSIAGEHWDDFLPLTVNEKSWQIYQGIELPVYGTDNKEKWAVLLPKLEDANYIILSSNRAYGSLVSTSDRYPVISKYYQSLFDGNLGFEKIAEFTSRPTILLPGIHICITPPFMRYGIVSKPSQSCGEEGLVYIDDYADESFTVYDHPKVIVFKKVKQVDYGKLLGIDSLR